MKNKVHAEYDGVVIKKGKYQAYGQCEKNGKRRAADNSKTQTIYPQLFVHHLKENQPVDQKDGKTVFADHRKGGWNPREPGGTMFFEKHENRAG